MRRILFTFFLAAAAISASAQSMYDGLLFSESNYGGTARTIAMGNAFTALGGDLGSITLNPAGSAVARYSQMTLTPGLNVSTSKTQNTSYAFGDLRKTDRTTVSLPNVGFSFNFDTHRGSGIKGVTVAFVANSTNHFGDNSYASGPHYGTSFAGAMADAAYGLPYQDLILNTAYNYFTWDPALAVRSGMVSTVNGTDDTYVGVTEKYTTKDDGSYDYYVAGTLEQDYGRLITGSKYDYAFNVGLNISDWIFVGLNLGATSLSYDYEWYLKEAAQNPADFDIQYSTSEGPATTCFSNLKYQYNYKAEGSGVYAQLGVLLTPGSIFRVGASVKTPTALTMREKWSATAYTDFTTSSFNSSDDTPEGSQKYVLRTPVVVDLGVAANIAGCAVVSADYELMAYNSMRFKASGDADNSFFNEINVAARECLSNSHALRFGAEYKPIEQLAIRAGYNLNVSALKAEYDNFGDKFDTDLALTQAASFGLGYSSRGSFFCDAAVKCLLRGNETIKPYADYICDWDARKVLTSSPVINNFRTFWTAALTFGFRF